jgi:hypothetical protein
MAAYRLVSEEQGASVVFYDIDLKDGAPCHGIAPSWKDRRFQDNGWYNGFVGDWAIDPMLDCILGLRRRGLDWSVEVLH